MARTSVLGAAVTVLWPKGLNAQIYLDVNRFARRTAWAHAFMHDYALWLGLTLLALTFLTAYAVAWWRRDLQAAGLMFLGGAGTLIALGLNQLVGHAAKELRPYDTYPHALVLVGKANDYAFPSDHAVVAGALLMSVLLVLRRAPTRRRAIVAGRRLQHMGPPRSVTPVMLALSVVAAVLALFLCFARIYVGAHYPGDVVAGLALGIVVVLVVSAARPVVYRLLDWVDRTPLSLFVGRP